MKQPFALIIEDDPKLATIFATALESAEFKTEIAADGQTALERLGATTPSVVVLDLHLPHISGRNLLYKIRADERLTDTQVMIATADPSMAEGLRDEADLVLIKPISFGQLRDLAARLRPPDTLDL
ncbi:MAG: response regulator [Chloroflexota bacterium]